MQHEMHILVVDDNSPDGTSALVKCKMQSYPNLHLLSGAKKGLGTAYMRGMRHALDVLRADAVMQMDADFSHQPEDVPRLITEPYGRPCLRTSTSAISTSKATHFW